MDFNKWLTIEEAMLQLEDAAFPDEILIIGCDRGLNAEELYYYPDERKLESFMLGGDPHATHVMFIKRPKDDFILRPRDV